MFTNFRYFCKYSVRYNKNIINNSSKSNYIAEELNAITMRQKKQLKLLTRPINNYKAFLQITGSGAHGTSAFMMLRSDPIYYMFNCGEGTQRLCLEHHCKLSKVDHIFITSFSWKNVGGLPGTLITAQSNGVKELSIHAPEGLEKYINEIRSFLNLNLKISYPSTNISEPFKDHVMSVWYVPLTKSSKDTEENIDENQYELKTNGKRSINSVESMQESMNAEKKVKRTPEILCYICEFPPKPGKLLLSKCVEYGIRAGPERYLLKSGSSITTEDGRVIESKDVCEPESPKTAFIVVECPQKEYIDSLVNHPSFLKYQQSMISKDSEICAVLHFTPEEIFTDERYKKWVENFPFETEHVVFNEENTCLGSEAVHKNQYLLHILHPEIFPLLSTDCFKNPKETDNRYIHRAKAVQTLQIRPSCNSLVNVDIHKKPSEYTSTIYDDTQFVTQLKELKTAIAKMTADLNLANTPDYPRIVILGTGCSVPNKVRNTSGILLRIDKDTSILLDCGEGTLLQIVRKYGFLESDNILCTIKAIYVSHMHADHHLGLTSIISRRKKLTNDKLYLLSPRNLVRWFNFYNDQFENIKEQFVLINNYDLETSKPTSKTSLCNALNIKDIITTYVNHTKFSYGVAIILQDDKKIVYSGDTMFSSNLITLGKNCDLLIHEATMEDGREDMARQKSHSTVSEAISVGRYMQAKFTLLTHFSQRYAKIPIIPQETSNVGFAFDFMEIKLSQLKLLPLLHPCLNTMFTDSKDRVHFV